MKYFTSVVLAFGTTVALAGGYLVWQQSATSAQTENISITQQPSDYHDDRTTRQQQILQQTVDALGIRLRALEQQPAPPLAQLEAKLQQLEEHIAELTRNPTVLNRSESTADNGEESAPGQTEEVSEDEARLAVEQEMLRISDHYEQLAWQEPQDPVWSEEVQSVLEANWNDEVLKGSDLIDTVCHSSFCRVEVSHSDEQAYEQFIAGFGFMIPFESDSFYLPLKDGEEVIGTIAYFVNPQQG